MTEAFAFPPLVSAYMLDPRIKNAVDDLTPRTMVKGFDAAFFWNEFPAYVDTWLAAQQTVAHWCKAQAELWDAVWGNALGGTPDYAPRNRTHDDLDVGGIQECWQNNWVSRHVMVAGKPVSLVVHCDIEEAYVAIEFASRITQPQRRGLNLTDWAVNGYEINAPSVEVREGDSGIAVIDLAELRGHARAAVIALGGG